MLHIFSDCYAFIVFQGSITSAVIYAYRCDAAVRRRKSEVEAELKCGELRMERLGSAFAVALLVVFQINAMYFDQEANAPRTFSIIFNMFDASCIAWFCFRSTWSRNWIMAQFERATTEKDR